MNNQVQLNVNFKQKKVIPQRTDEYQEPDLPSDDLDSAFKNLNMMLEKT